MLEAVSAATLLVRGAPLVLAAVLGGACIDFVADYDHPMIPVAELPWRTPPAMPPCVPFADTFAVPAVAAPTGLVQLDATMPLHATGVTTWLDVVVLDAGTGAADPSASGAITIDAGADATVVSVTPLIEGRAQVAVRFAAEGTFDVTATYPADGRTGVTQLIAYTSQLPIWEVTVDPADLEMMTDMPFERIQIDGALTVEGVAYTTTMRVHGGTSRDFVKKSFRFDLGDGEALRGADHLILRAEWVDKTLLRNWLGFTMIGGVTWLPAPRTELVHLRINDRFYGVMNHVERIDKDFLTANGMRTSGSLYEADPPNELASPGGNLSPLPAEDYPVVYAQQAGHGDHVDLIELIEQTLQLNVHDLVDVLPAELAVDDVLVYMAAQAVLQNWDHTRKNFYLYRDDVAGTGWSIIPWDLDLSLGHMWSEENDIFEERIVVDASPYVGWRELYNALFDRLLDIPELRARFGELARRLAATTLSRGYLDEHLDGATCLAMPDLLADQRKRASNDEYAGRLDEIRDFGAARTLVINALE